MIVCELIQVLLSDCTNNSLYTGVRVTGVKTRACADGRASRVVTSRGVSQSCQPVRVLRSNEGTKQLGNLGRHDNMTIESRDMMTSQFQPVHALTFFLCHAWL